MFVTLASQTTKFVYADISRYVVPFKLVLAEGAAPNDDFTKGFQPWKSAKPRDFPGSKILRRRGTRENL